MIAIRGAITAKNTKEDILDNTKIMLAKIFRLNKIRMKDIISIEFTMTKDLTKVYPAVAAREMGVLDAGLFCSQELDIEDSLKSCIRVMVYANSILNQNEVKHVYLKEAKRLRPDILTEDVVNIAVDGPAGAGKSTIAKIIASKLDYTYIDTGAMYRAIAVYVSENVNIEFDKNGTIKDTSLKEINCFVEKNINTIEIDIETKKDGCLVFITEKCSKKRDVTPYIRENKISQVASVISTISNVREYLVECQQKIAMQKPVVMDGRDIGTVVLPDAKIKFYLTASSEVRGKRRYKELIAKGNEADLEQIIKEIEERDYRDMNRDISPLKQAKDAILVDSSEMDIEEVVMFMYSKILEKNR